MNKTSSAATVTALAVSLLPLAASLGCSPGSIEGEVDGDAVPNFRTAVAYELKGMPADKDYMAVIAFYTFTGGCDLVAEWNETRADALDDAVNAQTQDDVDDAVDSVIDFEKDNLPDDYWAAYVFINDDDEDDLHDEAYEIDDESDNGVLVCHHDGETDPDGTLMAALIPDAFISIFAQDKNADCFRAEDGEIRLPQFDAGESAVVKAPLELEDEDGDDAGDVELGGVAGWCDGAEDPVEDMLEMLLE